jgi:hypothetical protein
MDYNSAVNSGIQRFTDKYTIDSEIIDDLRTFLLESGKKCVSVKVVAQPGSALAKAERRKTAYNIYIKSKFAEAKAEKDVRNSQELMTEYSRQWKSLSAEERAPYESDARDSNASLPAVTSTGATRKMSGYNFFYQQMKDQLKEEAKTKDVKLMAHVGATWKALSEDEKKDWNERASASSSA